MKKVLLLSSLLALGAAASYGATACVAGSTLSTLVGLGSTGCEVGDKIYSNFVYTPNGTDPAATGVNVGFDNVPLLMESGLQFGSASSAIWTSNFTLTYTITIDQSQCLVLFGSSSCRIVEAQGAMQGSTTPNSATLSMALSGATTISLDALSTQDEVKQSFFAPNAGPINVTISSGGLSATSPISSFGLDVYQTVVPEPVSLSLTGLGLLGLGFFGRRRLKA